jgi:hypothetical protein
VYDTLPQVCQTQWLLSSSSDNGYSVFHPESWVEFSRSSVSFLKVPALYWRLRGETI